MSHYSVEQLETESHALIDRAVEGEEVVITRGGRPVAILQSFCVPDRLTPTPDQRRAALERARQRLATLPAYEGPSAAELIRQLRDAGVG